MKDKHSGGGSDFYEHLHTKTAEWKNCGYNKTEQVQISMYRTCGYIKWNTFKHIHALLCIRALWLES